MANANLHSVVVELDGLLDEYEKTCARSIDISGDTALLLVGALKKTREYLHERIRAHQDEYGPESTINLYDALILKALKG